MKLAQYMTTKRLTAALIAPLLSMGACSYCNSVKQEQFKGIVIEKHVDRSSRNVHTTIVLAGAKHFPLFTYYDDTTVFYHNVNVGDSIIEQKGTTAYRIKTLGSNRLYEFNCN